MDYCFYCEDTGICSECDGAGCEWCYNTGECFDCDEEDYEA